MWRIEKYNLCKIIDDSTGIIITTELNEAQAKALCDKHNSEANEQKWENSIKKKV